ncbi:MAG TPA: hypothetical protein VGH19_06665 [Verrucomicrobiae bacterium]
MNAQLKNILTSLQKRPILLCGTRVDGSDLHTSVDAKFAAMLASNVTEAQQLEMIRGAWKSETVREQLCGIRLEQTQNYVYATLGWASMFYGLEELGPSDRAYFQNNTKQETAVYYIANGGKPRKSEVIPVQDEFAVPMRFLTTERVGYQIEDINNGIIRDAALATLDVAYDRRRKIDSLAFANLTQVYGDFVTTGKKSLRTYLAHSGIHQSALPTSNDITVPDTTNSTKFRFEVFDSILEYCDRLAGAFKDGDLRPTGNIRVPSTDTTHLLKQVSYTGNANNRLPESVRQNYLQVSHGNVDWTLIPDNTIPSGKCYPELNKKVGKIYSKPALEHEFMKTDLENNWEERWERFPHGSYIPEVNRLHALRVTYKS